MRVTIRDGQMETAKRLAHTIPQACEIANLGRTKLYEEIAASRLRIVKFGRRTLIRDEELRRWLAAAETVSGEQV